MVNPSESGWNQPLSVEGAHAEQRLIPESEYVITFVRSSGPGGQKVNKTSSKAELRWSLARSTFFDEEQEAVLRIKLKNRINKEDELVLASDQHRSQLQNRAAVVERLNELVAEALEPEIERKATKPTKGSQERRMAEKTKHGKKKEGRGKVEHE